MLCVTLFCFFINDLFFVSTITAIFRSLVVRMVSIPLCLKFRI
jgi:hypothetical protein